LDVQGAAGNIARITDGTNHFLFYAGSGLNEIATVSPLLLSVGGAERLRINTSGNLGLGVVPSAWNYSGNIQIVDGGTIGSIGTYIHHVTNAFFDGSWKYRQSTFAARYSQEIGSHVWYTAPSGTAGNAISFTQAMTLDASGRLGLGTTSPESKFHIFNSTNLGGTTGDYLLLKSLQNPGGAGGNNAYERTWAYRTGTGTDWTTWSIWTGISIDASYGTPTTSKTWYWREPLTGKQHFGDSTTNVMTIGPSNVGIGTTSPTAKLHTFSGTSNNQLTVDGTGAIKSGINFASGGTTYGQIYFDNNAPYDMSVLQQYTTGSLILGTNNTERLRITSGGNLLVGGTTSLARTTILSDSSAQTIGLIGRSGDNISTIRWWNNAGNTIYTAIESNANYTIYNTVTNGYAAFFTNNTERLRITSGGSVGVGTTDINRKFVVGGSAGNSILAIQDANSGYGAGDGFQLQLSSASDAYVRNYENTATIFHTNDTERLRIKSSGVINISNIPTSSVGLSSGDIYSSAGVLMIV
jgi:hypothetical protein